MREIFYLGVSLRAIKESVQVTSKAIVLTSLKYGDNNLIAKTYTAQAGLQSFMLRGILKSRKGKLKVAHFQPLTQLEFVANLSPSGKLGYVKEAVISYPYTTIHTDIRKSTIAMFLSEMLSQSISQEEPDLPLFRYLEASLQWLDQHDNIANFHIHFLVGLTRYLGFYPDRTEQKAPFFDMIEGAFCRQLPLNLCMEGEVLGHFKAFLDAGLDTIHHLKMSHKQRQVLLQNLVRYYEVHLHGFKNPRSLIVLDEVFS